MMRKARFGAGVRAFLLAMALLPALVAPARAQFGAGGAGAIPEPKELVKIAVAPVHVPAGGSVRVPVQLTIADGWHINANPAANENAIATEVSIAGAAGLAGTPPAYPAPKVEKLSFDPDPLLVYDGATAIPVTVKAGAGAAGGAHVLKGTIRFQACNDQVCLPPATLTFDVPITVDAVAAGAAGTPGDTTAATPPADTAGAGLAAAPPAGSGFATAPPAGYAVSDSKVNSNTASRKLGEALAKGGVWWFLALFVGGLLLNLTPCVFPMLGVTLSIFGARRKEPIARVLSHA